MLQEEGSYIIAADKLADNFIKECDLKIVSSTKVAGKDLVGIKYEHPLNKKLNPVINTDFVTMDSGVGIVHIAPGHGEDDFYAGLKWNLDIFCPVNEKGVFTKEAGEFEGLHIFKANPIIIERLKELGSLLKQQDITHSYPHCWRCKKPIIFRATEQWFMSVDKDNLRKKLVSEIEKVKWYPAGGQKRITSMVELRPDWCLSRQRFWGVPLMVFYCKKCGKVQIDAKLFKLIADRAKKEGSDFWFTDTCEQILPKDYTCSCGSKEFTKEKDILDVWFDSGVSWKETLKYRDLGFPADVYLEGSDQHRGWFQTSLIASTVLEDKAPFKKVITHGMIVDQEGKAMHKSAGNAISPDQIINKNGADILRLWVSFTDYSDDVRLSEKILEGPIDSYRKIRNTNGQVFFVGEDKSYSWTYFITTMAEKMGVPKPFMFTLPLWALEGVAWCYQNLAKIFKFTPALNYDKVREAAIKGDWVFTSKKWNDLTAQKFTPLEQALEESFK